MRFPFSFQRFKNSGPAGAPALGSDFAPAWDAAGPVPRDNYFAIKSTTANGYGLAGFVLAYSGPTATIDIELWTWEDQTRSWIRLNDAVTLTRGEATHFEWQVPAEIGSIDLYAYPKPAGTEANGAYTFALSPTHTP